MQLENFSAIVFCDGFSKYILFRSHANKKKSYQASWKTPYSYHCNTIGSSTYCCTINFGYLFTCIRASNSRGRLVSTLESWMVNIAIFFRIAWMLNKVFNLWRDTFGNPIFFIVFSDPISRPGLLTSFHLVFVGLSLGQHKFRVFNITLCGPASQIVFVYYYPLNVKSVSLSSSTPNSFLLY